MVSGIPSPQVDRPGHEANHSSPFSAEIKNKWIHVSTPAMTSSRVYELSYNEVSIKIRIQKESLNPAVFKLYPNILCTVDRASLYNLVNKANLVHNFS